MLNRAEQVARWREGGEGRPCDVMIDTGMNRLGLRIEDVRGGALGGLVIETLLSHIASADEDSAQNDRQGADFAAVPAAVPARRASLAHRAGGWPGAGYGLGLLTPSLAPAGGVRPAG